MTTTPAQPASDKRPSTPSSDFNDAAREFGPEVVRARIAAALDNPAAAPSPYRVDSRGVWYCGADGHDVRISDPLRVLAMTRDRMSGMWGRLLEWSDADGTPHRLTVAASLLIGDGRELGRLLADNGLNITPGANALQRLAAFIMEQRPDGRARCVHLPGWHDGCYMLPTGEGIGADDDALVYQHSGAVTLAYSEQGDWAQQVAPLCIGNPFLLFAVSCVLAGPLLHIVGLGGGGFHFVGDSSTGKSTLLRVAASVAGGPELVREWRATANGLEGVATLHNDATIIMDEMAQISAQEVGEAAYLLANGQGKSRSNRSGEARAAAQWRTLILSAGEVGLAQHMATVGKRARAGQSVRLVDMPADAGAGMGAFESVHHAEGPAAFSALLRERAADNHGTAWRPWLTWLAGQSPALLKRRFMQIRGELRGEIDANADGQVVRVVERFALAATAGELATDAGLTGWPKGTAAASAVTAMHAWLRVRGGIGNSDMTALLAQVRAFFELHGESRFDPLHPEPRSRPVNSRAGFIRNDAQGRTVYLVMPEVMTRELCAGHSPSSAKKWLLHAGWLLPGTDGRPHSRHHVPGMGKATLYAFSATAVHGEDSP